MAIPPQVTHNSPQSSPHLTAPTMSVCRNCRCNPCLVLLHQDALTGQLSVLNNSMSSSHKRNVLYRCFVRTEYGVLGRRNLVCIPLCIVKFIRSICPSDDGRYTGHQTVEGGDDVDDDESVEDDTANTSYEKIQEEASPKHVGFDDGEKIRLSLYFRDIVSLVLSMSVNLSFNHPQMDGRSHTNKNCSPPPPSFVKTNVHTRVCGCFDLVK